MFGKLQILLLFFIVSIYSQDSLLLSGIPQWHQGWPFNMYCPDDTSVLNDEFYNGHSPTGCQPLAIAQILRYYRYPEKGTGFVTYTTPSDLTISMDFDTCIFDWEHIPLTCGTSNALIEQESVAHLIYTVGVMCKTEYTSSKSSAYLLPFGIDVHRYLKFGGNLRCYVRSTIGDSVWNHVLVNELLSRRPVLFFGTSSKAAHVFVIDGYNIRDDKIYYHVNFGDGSSGSYYPLDSLKIEGDLFNNMQLTYIPFAPASVPTPENLRYGKNGNHFIIEWDPVTDTNVCGYYLYRWNEDNTFRTEYRCSKDKTTIRLLNYTIEEEITRIFPDGIDTVEFNVVSIANDSTGSIISNTLTVTRQNLVETMHTVNSPREIISDKNVFLHVRKIGISITFPKNEYIVPQKINLLGLNGKLIKSVSIDKQFSQEYFISLEKCFVPSLVVIQIKMSDGNIFNRLITPPR